MRRFLINIIAVTLPCLLICFILLELVFRFVIPASQLPDTVWCESGGIPHFDTKGKTDGIFTAGRFAQLRAQWHINNDGWISETDYSDTRLPGRRLIAIIGDSYIEALAVGVNKNVSAVLGRLLGSQVDVYSFGYAGSPLSQYLQMSRYVARKYKPDIFVINVVHNDFAESLAELASFPHFMQLERLHGLLEEREPIPYIPNPLKRMVKKSAVVRYVAENLNVRQRFAGSLSGLFRSKNYNANIDVDQAAKNRQAIREATFYLVTQLRKENPKAAIIFVMDCPRNDLYNGRLETSPVMWMASMLRESCRVNNCEFIDLSDLFSAHYKKNGMAFDSPYDPHWNELAHKLVAGALAEKINSKGLLQPSYQSR